MTAFEKWKASRQADILAAQGDVSLIAMHDIKEAMSVAEVAGTWGPTSENSGFAVKAAVGGKNE